MKKIHRVSNKTNPTRYDKQGKGFVHLAHRDHARDGAPIVGYNMTANQKHKIIKQPIRNS